MTEHRFTSVNVDNKAQLPELADPNIDIHMTTGHMQERLKDVTLPFLAETHGDLARQEVFEGTLNTLAHCNRVGSVAKILLARFKPEYFGLPNVDQSAWEKFLNMCGRVHDIGKFDPELIKIVSKKQPITSEEREENHNHPNLGLFMLNQNSDTLCENSKKFLDFAKLIAATHHTWSKGNYPTNAVNEISKLFELYQNEFNPVTKNQINATIWATEVFNAIDIFDACQDPARRVYGRGNKTPDQALTELKNEKTQHGLQAFSGETINLIKHAMPVLRDMYTNVKHPLESNLSAQELLDGKW